MYFSWFRYSLWSSNKPVIRPAAPAHGGSGGAFLRAVCLCPRVRGLRSRTRPVPFCHFVTFPPPRGGIFPKPPARIFFRPRRSRRKGRSGRPLTPPAPSFLMEEKMEKDHLRGTAVPLKDSPAGERSGRPARGPSPFVATRHFPRTAGESSPPPRPGNCEIGSHIVRARWLFLPG